MIEDEQILLQNLSSDPQETSTSSPNQIQIKFEGDHLLEWQTEDKKIITEKQARRKYYIDWNQIDNHHYFTNNISEETQDTLHLENDLVQPNLTHPEHQSPHNDYRELSKKLQIALNLIKNSYRLKEVKFKEKRSQSNQPRKQRERKSLTKTGFAFKGHEIRERKISMNYRVKTEFEDESIMEQQNLFKQNKMEKYQTHHIITQQKQQINAKQYKQNTLRNKFLDSIAQWQEKKQKRIQERIQKEMKLTMEGVTFTPQINAKSREIMKKKGNVAPIYERQHRERKRQLTERFNVDQKLHRMKL